MTIKELESLDVSKYFIDMDGVILHSVEAMVNMLNKYYDKDVRPEQITSWNFGCCYNQMTDEQVESLFSAEEFFNYVKLIEGSKDFILKHIDDVVLVTKGRNENIKHKRTFLDMNGLEKCKMIGLPLNISKDYINMKDGVFIDDSTRNLKEVTTAKYKIQFKEYDNETEWSADWNGEIMRSWI